MYRRAKMLRSRGSGGRTLQTRAPKNKVNQNSNRGKRKCERGSNCPYLHEHQHLSEFYHDMENDRGQQTSSSSRAPVTFTGEGQRLGGSRTLAVPSLRREALVRALDARLNLSSSTALSERNSSLEDSSSLNGKSAKSSLTSCPQSVNSSKKLKVIDLTDDD